MNAEKWSYDTKGRRNFNYAYVKELEASVKEMAEAIVIHWHERVSETVSRCRFCSSVNVYVFHGSSAFHCDHADSCPVPRAEQYLKGA